VILSRSSLTWFEKDTIVLTMRIGVLPLVLGLGVDLAEPGSRERGIFDRLTFKMHHSKLLVKIRPSCFFTRWMQCLSKFFRKKLRVPPLVDPQAVDINILPTSPSQRGKNKILG
jgi:hypothetical protein